MVFLAPRIAPESSVAMARVGFRFYSISILLVASTVYLPHKSLHNPYGLAGLAVIAAVNMVFLALFPWGRHEPRVFTLAYLSSSSVLLTILVYLTGGIQSNYSSLFFLMILFSYYYELIEMFSITAVVSLFYLAPYVYSSPEQYRVAASAVTVFVLFSFTYMLYGVTRFVLKKNAILEELNGTLSDLHASTSVLMREVEQGALPEALSRVLKGHVPSTYCIVLLLDGKHNLVARAVYPIRSLAGEPSIGVVYGRGRLSSVREVLRTRQPHFYTLDLDTIDDDLKKMLTRTTCSALIVPIRAADEDMGVLIFGEERHGNRSLFANERIQLAVALSNQIAVGLTMSRCFEKLAEARYKLAASHDKIVKAERLATLGEFTRAVEHEINNPLSVIVNWSEIYREDPSIDAELQKKFQIIYDMSIRINTVIRKLSELKDARTVEFMAGQKMTDIK